MLPKIAPLIAINIAVTKIPCYNIGSWQLPET